MNPPLGKNASERLDYSIQRIASVSDGGTEAGKVPQGTNAAIQTLRKHWAEFWASPARKELPDLALQARLDRYADWYTRAWVILPTAQRALVPSPGELDTSVEAVANDTIERVLERGRTVAEEAKALQKSILATATSATFTGVLGILLGLGVAWYFIRGARR